jgi:hypothetical protein
MKGEVPHGLSPTQKQLPRWEHLLREKELDGLATRLFLAWGLSARHGVLQPTAESESEERAYAFGSG